MGGFNSIRAVGPEPAVAPILVIFIEFNPTKFVSRGIFLLRTLCFLYVPSARMDADYECVHPFLFSASRVKVERD